MKSRNKKQGEKRIKQCSDKSFCARDCGICWYGALVARSYKRQSFIRALYIKIQHEVLDSSTSSTVGISHQMLRRHRVIGTKQALPVINNELNEP
jgi:hypothetical protein